MLRKVSDTLYTLRLNESDRPDRKAASQVFAGLEMREGIKVLGGMSYLGSSMGFDLFSQRFVKP